MSKLMLILKFIEFFLYGVAIFVLFIALLYGFIKFNEWLYEHFD